MNHDRPIPPPAIAAKPTRQPERIILRLSDGYKTSVYVHRPPADAAKDKPPVLYVHGIQSHPGWFYGSAMAMAEAGYTVYQLTRRGCGDNKRARGHQPMGCRAYRDIVTACRFVLKNENAQRLHLLGVSWGGKLLASFAAREKKFRDKIASLILVAPGVAPKVDVPLTTKFAVAACLFSPLVLVRVRFDIPLNDVELFTENHAMQEYLRRDEYQLHRATASFMFESRRIDIDIKKARADSLKCPTTLILASRDRIIDNDETRNTMKNLAGEQLHTVELSGSHTLEFEPDPSPLYRAIIQAAARSE